MSNIYAALEIGTSKTVLAIGESSTGGRLKVTCHAEIPSTGIRKSQILDIPQATQSIRSVLQKIEKLQEENEKGSQITIGNALLVVSGQHIKSDPYSGVTQVEGARVTEDDISRVASEAHNTPTLSRDRELLDIEDQDFVLDSRGGISTPAGMSGRILKLNTLHIHADHNRIQDARTAADAAHLEIREPLFSVTCAADAVLEDFEKRNGVLVLDLGGGSTGYAVYSDGYLAASGVIGVGGDHVTSDIAHAFQTTNAQAEGIKIAEANALVSTSPEQSPRVKVEQDDNPLLDNRTISRSALNTVVNARMMELFMVIRDTLEEQDLLHRLHAGVVLVGGGARLKNVDVLAEQILGTNARIGRPIHVDGLDEEEFPAAYAAISGALLYANRNYEDKSILDGLLRFFSK